MIVVELRSRGRPVVVLQCAAPRHRAHELDALILAQHANVIADDAQGFAQLVGEFTGTGFAFAEPLEDPCPQWMREGFGDPGLCGFTQWAVSASTDEDDATFGIGACLPGSDMPTFRKTQCRSDPAVRAEGVSVRRGDPDGQEREVVAHRSFDGRGDVLDDAFGGLADGGGEDRVELLGCPTPRALRP